MGEFLDPGIALAHLAALLFVLANAAQLAILRYRSRVGDMDREARELLEHVLRVEVPARQRRMLGLLEWRDAAVGEVLIRQEQLGPPLIYIASGAAAIEHASLPPDISAEARVR